MLWVCIGGAGAADRGLGPLVLAAELPQPRARHGAGAGGRQGGAGRAVRRARQRRLGRGRRPRRRSRPGAQAAHASRCCASLRCSCWASPSARRRSASRCRRKPQFALIALGGFLMTCTVGPVGGDRDRRHPPRRARHRRLGAGAVPEPVRPGRSARSSPACCRTPGRLETALTIMPVFGLVAVGAFLIAVAHLRSRHRRCRRRGRRSRRRPPRRSRAVA